LCLLPVGKIVQWLRHEFVEFGGYPWLLMKNPNPIYGSTSVDTPTGSHI
jgi:hypothetical protein